MKILALSIIEDCNLAATFFQQFARVTYAICTIDFETCKLD